MQAGGMLQLQEEFCQKVKTENHGLLSNKTLSIHKTNHSSNLYYERKKKTLNSQEDNLFNVKCISSGVHVNTLFSTSPLLMPELQFSSKLPQPR